MKRRVLAAVLAVLVLAGMGVPAAAAEEIKPYSLFTSLSDDYILKANGELWYLDNRADYDNVLEDGSYGRMPPALAYTGVAAVASALCWQAPFDRSTPAFCLMSNGELYLIWRVNGDGTVFDRELIDSGVSRLYSNLYLKGDELYAMYSQASHLLASDVIGFTGYTTNLGELDNVAYLTSDHVLHNGYSEYPGYSQVFSLIPRYGYTTFFAVSDDGALYAWGENSNGQVGNGGGDYKHNWASGLVGMGAQAGDLYPIRLEERAPAKVLDGVSALYLDEHRVYARDKSGVLWVWGDATEWFKAPLRAYEGTLASFYIVDDEIIPPEDLTGYSPRRSETAQPVRESVYGFTFLPDGSIQHDTLTLPFKLSELVADGPNGLMVVENVAPFTDVLNIDWFSAPVRWGLENNVISGQAGSKFEPYAGCPRSEVVTMLWRAAGTPEPTLSESPFPDVSPEDPFYKAVLWAYESDVTTGSGGLFLPNETVTRADAVTFLWRAAGRPAADPWYFSFPDLNPDPLYYYRFPVAWAIRHAITNGSGGLFLPDEGVTRGQMITFLYRWKTDTLS